MQRLDAVAVCTQRLQIRWLVVCMVAVYVVDVELARVFRNEPAPNTTLPLM